MPLERLKNATEFCANFVAYVQSTLLFLLSVVFFTASDASHSSELVCYLFDAMQGATSPDAVRSSEPAFGQHGVWSICLAHLLQKHNMARRKSLNAIHS